MEKNLWDRQQVPSDRLVRMVWALLGLMGSLLLGGCEKPSLPPDPGQIVFEIPKVEGTEEPYPLEPLGRPPQEALDQLRLP